MNLKRFVGKCVAAWYVIRGKSYPGFSQAGEDQLMRYLLFSCLDIEKPTYLDIGANHPVTCNNTYFFYLRGSKGVCIEPDHRFFNLLKGRRKRDVVLHAGIGMKDSKDASLYAFPHPNTGWNTFIKEEAEIRAKQSGIPYTIIESMRLMNINDVIERYFDKCPNIISIDVEGLDLEILQSLDFSRFQPEIICVESITFSVHNDGKKMSAIMDFMLSMNYFIFGDTHVNTIFCRNDAFKKIQR